MQKPPSPALVTIRSVVPVTLCAAICTSASGLPSGFRATPLRLHDNFDFVASRFPGMLDRSIGVPMVD